MKIEANPFSSNRHRGQSFEKPTQCADTKFHRAAIDGYVDMLCDASKRDTNLASRDNGLTPTLLAAHHGHLEALRILVGRGGDPERTGASGLTALHLAAGRNHLNCVSFLVNFGVNMWALDNELRTAKDIAAIEQSKEVLEYLDQIMAKQSALNTKNVQKLKEKAKVASEKRLKQVRKAQLKAIKQVEKDERYLVKLSNNRRLLKAAHSISDIKLVGRSDQPSHQHKISYSPSESRHLMNGSALVTPSGCSSALGAESSRLSSSPNISNHFINHKLHMDLLNRPKQLKFRLNNLSSSSASNSTTDESAYSSSSVSSTSGYLSTGCGGGGSTSAFSVFGAKSQSSSIAAKENEPRRPKYSDLVAVTNDQQVMANSRLRVKSSEKDAKNEQQSLKSNSTIGNKLRGIGGVSRKVHLKRLLLVNTCSQSSGNIASPEISVHEPEDPAITSRNSERQQETGRQVEVGGSRGSGGGKLCNVQPAIKLKLNRLDGNQRQQQVQSTSRKSSSGCSGGETEQANIEWPPAPSMTRAISEPDFGLALRCITDDQTSVGGKNMLLENYELDGAACDELDSKVDGAAAKAAEPSSDAPNVPDTDEPAAIGSQSTRDNCDESRHLLLTQCLSQLKMRHQAILNDRLIETEAKVSGQVTKVAHNNTGCGIAAPRQQQQANSLYRTSDELLQHQLSAGEFPLRPSVIKQQQQQQQHQLQMQPSVSSGCNRKQQQFCSVGKTSTTISVDSIGSAGSLAQRNSTESSSSSKSSRSSTSISTYASSCTSSMEVTKVARNSSQVTVQKDIRPIALGSCREEAQQAPEKHKDSTPNAPGNPGTHCQDSVETIETFLLANGLIELSEVFDREKIDLEALMLLTEDDLKSLEILLGPRRKLLKAVAIRQAGRQSESKPLGPMFIMVDTPL